MDAALSTATRQVLLNRTTVATLIALSAGAVALVAPPAALLLLALLGARTLMRVDGLKLSLTELAGPLFAAALTGAFVGLDGAVGVLFVWRLYADTRWSTFETRRMAEAAGRPGETRFLALAHLWFTPLYGLTLVAFTAPHMVAGLPLDLPHVPILVPVAAGAAAALAVFDWAVRRAADWRLGELAAAPALHGLAHHFLFLVAFGMMLDVSAGLVALIAWRLAHAAPAFSFAQKRQTADI